MESPEHSINLLFEQLGLDDSEQAIAQFISQHRPLPHQVLLHEASFWSKAQAGFLKQAVDDDADWAIVVDQLDNMLR